MKLGHDPRPDLVLTPLERAVLEAGAASLGGDAAAAWRAQCRGARVLSRTHSGVGFVTRFEVPAEAVALDADAARRVGPVHASHPALREPAEFVLQLRAGRLSALEAFCFEGLWPAEEAGFRIADAP